MPRRPQNRKPALPLRRFAAARDGGVAVTVAIVTPVLIGMIALSLDLGRAWSTQTELQSAADAAALAGATQLDGNTGACDRAEDAAVSDLISNLQTFATDDEARVAIDRKSDIFFYVSLDDRTDLSGDPNDADCDANANYIEVRVEPHTVSFVLAPVLAALTDQRGTALIEANPSGRAVAHMGQAICRVTPLFVCMPSGGIDTGEMDRGNGIWMMGGENRPGPGNFGFLAMGGQQFGANETREAMGSDGSGAQCIGRDESMETEPGRMAAVSQGFNTRFDWYRGAAKGWESEHEFRPSTNPVAGLINESNNSSNWDRPDDYYQGPTIHTVGTDSDGNTTVSPEIQAMGYPRDNCAYSSGGSSCVPSGSEGQFGDGQWDIATYMAVNHGYSDWTEVFANDPDLILDEFNAANPPHRFDIFKWELGIDGGANRLPQQDPALFPEFGTSQFPADPIRENSRRTMTVAVVDCEGIKGRTPINPLEWFDIFLTEPMSPSGAASRATHPEFADPAAFYAEVIGKAEAQPEFKPTVHRNVLQLVE